MIQEIIKIMQAQQAIYLRIFDCSKIQQAAIIAAKSQELGDANEQQALLFDNASKLEHSREKLAAVLCQKLSIPESSSVSEICQKLDDAESRKLLSEAKKLNDILLKISELNELNAQLLKIHFDLIDCMVSAATHISQPSNIYGAKGIIQEDDSAPRAILTFEA